MQLGSDRAILKAAPDKPIDSARNRIPFA